MAALVIGALMFLLGIAAVRRLEGPFEMAASVLAIAGIALVLVGACAIAVWVSFHSGFRILYESQNAIPSLETGFGNVHL